MYYSLVYFYLCVINGEGSLEGPVGGSAAG